MVCLLSSCDWLKHTLGMKTSQEIERMMQLENEAKQRMKLQQDSLEAVQAAAEAVEKAAGTSDLNSRFYVILGSFKEQTNIDSMLDMAKACGFNPVVIPLTNGFTMVASSGHATLPEACSAKIRVEELDICPYDIWIYDVEQGLHK